MLANMLCGGILASDAPPARAASAPTSKLRSISISWVSPTEPPCSVTESHVTRWGSVCSRVAYQA